MPSLSRLQVEILVTAPPAFLLSLLAPLAVRFLLANRLQEALGFGAFRLPRRPLLVQLRPHQLGLQLYGCFFSLARFSLARSIIAACPAGVVTAHSSFHRSISRISRAFSRAAGPTV